MNEDGGISFEPLLGHDEAEQLFLHALNSDRLHHAWLFSGPKGIGKASLAYRLSALLLSDVADGLIHEDHPAIRLLKNEAHPDLRVLKRAVDPKTGKLKSEISVADVRVLQGFLGSTAAQGGWRIIIIDAADDLNRNAANALLKILEEPPKKVAFFLISHAPGRLLPTIRSRCRHLPMHPLSDAQVDAILSRKLPDIDPTDARDLSLLAVGSPGLALELAGAGGAEIYQAIKVLFDELPGVEMSRVHALADMISKRKKEDAFATFSLVLTRLVETRIRLASRNGGADILSAQSWLVFYDELVEELAKARGLNLEPRYVILSLFSHLAQIAKAQA